MRKASRTSVLRLIALALAAALTLPQPVHALRQPERAEAKGGLEELEQALQPILSAFSIPKTLTPTTGLEETAPRTNIVPIVTPLTRNENGQLVVDEAALPRYMKHLSAMRAKALLMVGATGEFHRMDKDLRQSAIRQLTLAAKGKFTVFTNITGANEEEALENARTAERAGADVLVVAPLFYLPGNEQIEAHLDHLRQTTQLPIALYNNPGLHRGANISLRVVEELWADRKIVAIKDSSGDMDLLTAYVETGIPVYQGDEGNIEAALQAGARGTVGSSGSVWRSLQEIPVTDDLKRVRQLQEQLGSFRGDLTAGLKKIPAGLKRILSRTLVEGAPMMETTLTPGIPSLSSEEAARIDAISPQWAAGTAGLEEIGRPGVPSSRRAVLFGAGNIGRGHLAPLLAADDFDLIFADVNEKLVSEANTRESYTVTPVGGGQPVTVQNFWGLDVRNEESVAAVGPAADWIFTSVGANNIPRLKSVIHRFIKNRLEAGHRDVLNIVFAENLPVDQPQIAALRSAVLDLAGEDPDLRRYIEDRVNFIGSGQVYGDLDGYLDYVQRDVGWVGAVVHITVPETIAASSENPLDVRVEGGGPYYLEVDAQELRNTPNLPAAIHPVENIRAAREKKLLIHNMGHAMLAYLSAALGISDPAEGIRDPRVRTIVRQAMWESAQGMHRRYRDLFPLPVLESYVDGLIARFGNRELNDTVERIARDPMRKLAENDRLFGAAAMAREAGVSPEAIGLGIAAAVFYAERVNGVADGTLAPVLQRAEQMGLKLPRDPVAFEQEWSRLSAAGVEENRTRRQWLGGALGSLLGGGGGFLLGSSLADRWADNMDYGLGRSPPITMQEKLQMHAARWGIPGARGLTRIGNPFGLVAVDMEDPYVYLSMGAPQTQAAVRSEQHSAPAEGYIHEEESLAGRRILPVLERRSEIVTLEIQPVRNQWDTTLRIPVRLPSGARLNSEDYDSFSLGVFVDDTVDYLTARFVGVSTGSDETPIQELETDSLLPTEPALMPNEAKFQKLALVRFPPLTGSYFSAREWDRFGPIESLELTVSHQKDRPFHVQLHIPNAKRTVGYALFQAERKEAFQVNKKITGITSALLGSLVGGWLGWKWASRATRSTTDSAQSGLEEGETRPALAEAFAGFTTVYGARYGHKQSILRMNLRQAQGTDVGIVSIPGGILRKYDELNPQISRHRGIFSDWKNLGPDQQLTQPYAVQGVPGERLSMPVTFAAENEAIFIPVTPERPLAMTGPSYMTSVLVMGKVVNADGIPGLFQWHYFSESKQPKTIASRIQSDLPKFLESITQAGFSNRVQVVISAEADVAGAMDPTVLQQAWVSQNVQTVTVFPRTGVDLAPVANTEGFGFALLRGHLLYNSYLDMSNPSLWEADEERFPTLNWSSLQTGTMDTLFLPEVDYTAALFQVGSHSVGIDSEEFPAAEVFQIDRPVRVPFDFPARPGGFQAASFWEPGHDAVSEFLLLSPRVGHPETIELKRLTLTDSGQRDEGTAVVEPGKVYTSPLGVQISIRRGRGIVVQPQSGINRTFLQKVSAAGLEEGLPASPAEIEGVVSIMRSYGYSGFPAAEIAVRSYLAGRSTFDEATKLLTGSLNVNTEIEPGHPLSSRPMNPDAAKALLAAAEGVATKRLGHKGFLAITQYAANLSTPLEESVRVLRSDPKVAGRIDEEGARKILENARRKVHPAAGLEESEQSYRDRTYDQAIMLLNEHRPWKVTAVARAREPRVTYSVFGMGSEDRPETYFPKAVEFFDRFQGPSPDRLYTVTFFQQPWAPAGQLEAEITPSDSESGLEEDFSEFMGKKLYAVHATDHFPDGGIVKTHLHATKGRYPRNTVHWTLNHVVEDVEFSSWKRKRYFIVVPLQELAEANLGQGVGGTTVDFFFNENLTLPPSAQIFSSKQEVNDFLLTHATLETGGKWAWGLDSWEVTKHWLSWTEERGIFDQAHTYHWTSVWEKRYEQAPEYYWTFLDILHRTGITGITEEEMVRAVSQAFQLRSALWQEPDFLDFFTKPTIAPDFREFTRRIAEGALERGAIPAEDRGAFQSLLEKQLEYADGITAEAVLRALPRQITLDDIERFQELLGTNTPISPSTPEAAIQIALDRRGVTDRERRIVVSALMLERFEQVQGEIAEQARSIVRILPIQVTGKMLERIRNQFVATDQPVSFEKGTPEAQTRHLISISSPRVILANRSHLEAVFEEVERQFDPVRADMIRRAETIVRTMPANQVTRGHLDSFRGTKFALPGEESFDLGSPEATIRALPDAVTLDDVAQLEAEISSERLEPSELGQSRNDKFKSIHVAVVKTFVPTYDRVKTLQHFSTIRSEWNRVRDSMRAETWLKTQFETQGIDLHDWTWSRNMVELVQHLYTAGLEEMTDSWEHRSHPGRKGYDPEEVADRLVKALKGRWGKVVLSLSEAAGLLGGAPSQPTLSQNPELVAGINRSLRQKVQTPLTLVRFVKGRPGRPRQEATAGLEEVSTILDATALDDLAASRQFIFFGVHPDDIEQQLGGLVHQLAVRRAQITFGVLTTGAGMGVQDGRQVEVGVRSEFMQQIHQWPIEREVTIAEKEAQRQQEAREGAHRLGVRPEAVLFFRFGAGDTRTEDLNETLLDGTAQQKLVELMTSRLREDARPLTVVFHDPQTDRHPAHFKSAELLNATLQRVADETGQTIDVWRGALAAGDERVTHQFPMMAAEHNAKHETLSAHRTQVLHYEAKKRDSSAETMDEWMDRVEAASPTERRRFPSETPYVERYQRILVGPAAGLEEAQAVFRQWMEDEDWEIYFAEPGFVALDTERKSALDVPADSAAFIVSDEAIVSTDEHQIYADDRLTHPDRELLPWNESGTSAREVVQYARQRGAKRGDLLLIPPDAEVTVGQVEDLLRQAGYALDLSDAPRVVIAGQPQVEETALSTLGFLASYTELPRVVFLNVAMKLTDEAGNSYTLIVMA